MIQQQVVAGIDIGGTNTVFGLVDEHGKILHTDLVPTKLFPEPEQLIGAVSEKILAAIQPNMRLLGAGIGAPNGNFHYGTIEFAPNLNWRGVIPVARLFNEKLKCRAVLTNDANAAAIGEMMFGAAQGMKNFLFITLGTGLGSGIVVNGEMVYGHDGFAGELGHVIIFKEGRMCGCGRKGCLETYCSATGIVKTYLAQFNEDHFKEVEIDSKYIYEKAVAGEKEAVEAFNFTGEILGLELANSVAYTSPEAIFLFGGLAQAGDLIFKPVRESFEKNLLNIYKNKIQILPSLLQENSAAILGAASLIWKEVRKKGAF
jgi:glucokinase